ncbi:M20/M25/M40 family metallo-hydrolase [Alteribacter populi]|uniref:M20/M25/M40 family metallo-hydrolase n=1 Tax=Alteribacter populi TaxID=2011011 RepID=UPI000BBAE463|nr:M20/M25/M40 family metallo-hydrolase [Alteribacter populi]
MEVKHEQVKAVFDQLQNHKEIKKVLFSFQDKNELTLQDQIDLTAIPAPTFHEAERGAEFANRLRALGLHDVTTDANGNVFGVRKGTRKGPNLVICAHLDTVFPEGTDTVAKRKDGKVYAPGIADDGRGLAVVLTLIESLHLSSLKTKGNLIFGATVGEEGLGDLYGVKGLFEERSDIDGFISIEPGSPARIIYAGTGSLRYRVTFSGTGGHSFGDFGTPSAVHALGRAVQEISNLEIPYEPKTTFNVGEISGGTSVNTIAAEATMVIDLRSTEPEALKKLESKVLTIIEQAAEKENERWGKSVIQVEAMLVGNRPAGSQHTEDSIVQTAVAATKSIGFEPLLSPPISTDSNVPISLGVPALTLGGGGSFGGAHTLNEYFDPTDAFFGPQLIFLTMMALAGVEGVCEPTLPKKEGGDRL